MSKQNNSEDEQNITNTGFENLPRWLTAELFEEFLKKDYTDFKKITDFVVKPAVKTGENYMTVVLRVNLEVELKNGNKKDNKTFMVKIKPTPEQMQKMVEEWQVFRKEQTTYSELMPAFENYYKNIGCNIKFSPKILLPENQEIQNDCLILEDLRPKGFKNANRQQGLDMEHTKAVLKKLAQLHAVSAHHYAIKGPYPEIYNQSLNSKEDLIKEHRERYGQLLIDTLPLYGNFEYLSEKLDIYRTTKIDPYQCQTKPDPLKFNVLNHGDCWCNNIMFQYYSDGHLKDTYFVDLQMGRYGTPAQDLLYFILSSTALDIKIRHFDYFIFYYHQQLVKHLKLLNYTGKVPTLTDIHMALFEHDSWGYLIVSQLLIVVLADSCDDANVDNILKDDAVDFQRSMFTNKRFIENMKILLPWLNNRGAFDL